MPLFIEATQQVSATVTAPTGLDAIDPSSGKLPAMVVGEINSGATSVPTRP